MSHHYHEHVHDNETYYLDQLCLVALSGGFGAVCLSLYFWQTTMLDRMLGKQFHHFVLFSGVSLVILTVIRAVALWVSVGQQKGATHAHSSCCGHDHEPADSGHYHEHGPECQHGPHHEHEGHHHHGDAGHHHHHEDHPPGQHPHHSHGHGHGYGHDDHDHGWAPWRYVVMLVPIILFLLGLPNKGPSVRASDTNVDVTRDVTPEALATTAVLAMGPGGWNQLLLADWHGRILAASDGLGGEVTNIDFKTLENAAYEPERRRLWQGKAVRVRGQFAPNTRNDRVFNLARFSIQCCAADAVQLNVIIISKDSLAGIQAGQWVEVTGKVDFRERDGKFYTLMVIPGKKALKASAPDANPYI